MSRLSLSNEDRHVRNWFEKTATAYGCEIKIDEMGNMFAIMPGENANIAPIAMGSHLDTQPSGKPSLFKLSKVAVHLKHTHRRQI